MGIISDAWALSSFWGVAAPFLQIFTNSSYKPCYGFISLGKILGFGSLWLRFLMVTWPYLPVSFLCTTSHLWPQLPSGNKIRGEMHRSTKLILPMFGMATFILIIGRTHILEWLYTKNFTSAKVLFVPYFVGDFFKVLSWFWMHRLLAQNATKLLVVTEAAFCILGLPTPTR